MQIGKKTTSRIGRVSLDGSSTSRSRNWHTSAASQAVLHPSPNGHHASPISRWRRLGRGFQITIVVIVVLLVAARLAMPYVVRDYVNKQLHKLPDYSGHVSDIDIHLWRGAYKIRNLNISKTEGKVPVPFFSAPAIDISLQWHELFHGKIVGKILLIDPNVHFVSGPTEQQSQTGKNQPWEKTVESFYPFDLNQFEIQNGNVHFQDFYKSQPVDIYLTNLFLVATNLTNSRQKHERLPAGITAKATTLGNGEFSMNVKLDPLAQEPTYEMNATLTNVDLPELNDFLRGYAKVDVAKGNFSLFTSIASVNGKYDGFVKVLFTQLQVFAWEKERKKDILEIFWQAIVGTLSAGFKNHPHDQLAAQIPISGDDSKSHVGFIAATGSLLRNAFIHALIPTIGKPVKVEDVEKKKSP